MLYNHTKDIMLLFPAKVTEVTNQLKSNKSGLDAAKQELSDYKEKATRILQVKFSSYTLYYKSGSRYI